MIAEGTADELKDRTGRQVLTVRVPREQADAARRAGATLDPREELGLS